MAKVSNTNPESLFNDTHMDIFKEIASMGTAYAATALADIMDKKVSVSSLNVSWVDFQNTTDVVGGPDKVIAGILVSLSGNLRGMVIHLLNLESANIITNVMMGMSGEITEIKDEFNEMEISALEEMGNIMISSYITSLAELVQCKIKPSAPSLSIDMANAVLSVPVAEFGKMADQVLVIESKLSVDNVNFTGYFSFLPNLESFQQLLKMLGVA